MRTLAMPKAAEPWSLISLREKLIKIGAKVVSHGRYVAFQLAEVSVSRADVCGNLVADWAVARPARPSVSGGEVICDERRQRRSALRRAKRRVPTPRRSHLAVWTAICGRGARLPLPKTPERAILRPTTTGNPGNFG
jgi:hypothetical protein